MSKKMIFITVGGIVAIIAVVVFFMSSGDTPPAPVKTGPATLTMWMPFENSENLMPLISDFRAKNPNVNIIYTKKDINTYQTELLEALASGTGPDLYAIHNDWLPKYLDKTTSSPASVFGYKEFKDAFVDAVVNDFTDAGKIYGVALSVDSLALYYNKDLLGTAGIATPPKTWGELASQVQKIRKFDGRGYFTRSGAALGTNANVNRAVDILYLLMLQQGARPFSDDRLTPTFAESATKNGNYFNPGASGLGFYTSFADPNNINYNWNLRSDYSIDAFANGRAAFLYSYSYTRDSILQKSPNLNFDVAPVPQPNLDQPSVNFANYWGIVVSKQSKSPNTAWNFLKFLTSKESLDKYYARTRLPASRKDLIELQIQDPIIGVFANANLTAKTFYKPDQAKIDSIFGQAIDNVILSGKRVEEALSQAQQQAATLVRE